MSAYIPHWSRHTGWAAAFAIAAAGQGCEYCQSDPSPNCDFCAGPEYCADRAAYYANAADYAASEEEV